MHQIYAFGKQIIGLVIILEKGKFITYLNQVQKLF